LDAPTNGIIHLQLIADKRPVNGPWDSDHAYEKDRKHGRMK